MFEERYLCFPVFRVVERVITRVDLYKSKRFNEKWNFDNEYFLNMIEKIKNDPDEINKLDPTASLFRFMDFNYQIISNGIGRVLTNSHDDYEDSEIYPINSDLFDIELMRPVIETTLKYLKNEEEVEKYKSYLPFFKDIIKSN